MRHLGYNSSKADPDVHLRPATKKDGTTYYQMALAYVDDILLSGEDARLQMDLIEEKFKLKDGSVEEPTLYLGADISQFVILNFGEACH